MKKLATFLGIALVVTGFAAAYLWREAAAQSDRNAQAAARVAAAELTRSPGSSVAPTAAQSSQEAVIAVATSVPGTPGGLAAGAAAANVPAGRQQSAGAGSNPLMEAARQLQNSPEGQEMARVMMRQMLEQEFPDLAKEMNLSPDKAGKVLDLLARRRMEQSADLLNTQSGGKRDPAALADMARAIEKRSQAFQGELSALLGSSYPKWPEYESKAMGRQRDMYTRMEQEELRSSINSSGTPLTDAQFQYLNAALDAEQKRIDKEVMGMNQQQQLRRLPENNRRLAEVAASHLNPQQLQRYRQFLQQQEELVGMMDGMGVFR